MKDFHNYSMIYTTVYCATQAQLGQALPYPHHWATRLSTKLPLLHSWHLTHQSLLQFVIYSGSWNPFPQSQCKEAKWPNYEPVFSTHPSLNPAHLSQPDSTKYEIKHSLQTWCGIHFENGKTNGAQRWPLCLIQHSASPNPWFTIKNVRNIGILQKVIWTQDYYNCILNFVKMN